MTKEMSSSLPGLGPVMNVVILMGAILPAMAAIGDLRAVERSNTQISIEYTAPDSGPCRVEVSESASYSPLVHDVDGVLFAGANLDTRPGAYSAGGERVFIIGTRTVATASDGRLYSRALQQLTRHYIRVGCGAGFSDQAEITATTGYPTFSRSVRDPMLADTDHLPLWPDFSMTNRSEVVIEPMTGARITHFGMPADAVRIYNNINFSACTNLTSGWTIGTSCTATSGTPTTFTSASCSVACGWLQMSDLVLGSSLPPSEEQESNEASINSLLLHLTGQCSGANTSMADCTTQVCWSWDGTNCAGPMIDLVFPTTSGAVSLCSKNGSSTCIIGDLLGADYRGYLHQALGTGYLSTSGTSTTINTSSSADCAILKQNDTLVVTNAGLSVLNLNVTSKSCPTSVTVSSPVNLDPTSFTGSPGFPFYYYDSFYNNPRWSLLIRKKSLTANNTLSITAPGFDVTLGGFSSNTSAGYNEFCSQFLDSNGFRKCRMTTKIYAYQPTTGEVRYLGQFYGTGGGNGITSGQLCTQTGDGSTFWIDANSFYCTAPQSSDGKPRIWKIAFTGNTANDVENLPAPGANTAFVAGVTVTDMTGNLLALTHTFDSTFDSALTGNVGMCGFSGGRYIHFFVEAGAQDTLAWAAVYDTNNGLPIGSGGNGSVIAAWKTWASPSAARWGVNHACFWIAPDDGVAATANLMGMDLKRGRDDTAGGPLYHLTLAQNITTSTTTFNVVSTTPVGLQPPTTLQAVLAGDVFVCGGDGGETMQITVVNSTTNITVTRGAFISTPAAFSSGADCWMTPWMNHTTILQNDSGEFWDFLGEPHGPTINAHVYVSYCPGGGHAFYYSKWQAGSPNIAGSVILAGIENSLGSFPLCNPGTFSQDLAKPNFSTVALGPFSSAHEGHPGFKPTPYPLMLDNHPNIGEGLGLDSGLTLVTGTLFRLTYTETNAYADGDNLSLKFLPRLVTSQKRIFSDVSGPASSIGGTLSDGFTYCIVVRANECRSGSTAGQIYVNAPYLNPAYYTNAFGVVCWLNSQVTDDLCFEDDGQRAETVSGYVLPSTEATVTNPNTSFPVLEQFGMLPKGAPNTNNTKLMWGNWGYGSNYILPPYSTSYRLQSYFVKVPDSPPPFDSANRTAFQPEAVQIPSVPMGTNDVVVDFGYVEYGASTDFYCTTRREKCMAVQATINAANPFQFPAGGAGGVETGVAGVPCTVSCTVTIPVIPGYTVYFQIRYRDVNHITLATQQEAPRIVSNSQGSVQLR